MPAGRALAEAAADADGAVLALEAAALAAADGAVLAAVEAAEEALAAAGGAVLAALEGRAEAEAAGAVVAVGVAVPPQAVIAIMIATKKPTIANERRTPWRDCVPCTRLMELIPGFPSLRSGPSSPFRAPPASTSADAGHPVVPPRRDEG